MNVVDRAALELIQDIQHPILDEVALLISHSTSYAVLFLIWILLIHFKKNELSLNMLTGLIIEGAITLTLKTVIGRPRPISRDLRPNMSFPSGHTSRSTYLALLFNNRWSKKLLWFSLASMSIFSRIYLRVHHFTDILGGIAVGYFAYWIVMKYKLGEKVYEKIYEKIPVVKDILKPNTQTRNQSQK